jgi:hypothetical protein
MTLDTAVEQTCPRCGSNAAGAPWCPSCGLNLRQHTLETAAPPSAAYTVPRSGPSRRRLIALVVGGLLALGGALAAVALLAFGSSSPKSAVATTVVQTVPATRSGAATVLPVTVDEMHNVLLAYVNAYSAEDAAALGRLFAPDLVRRNGNGPFEDRAAALATYQQQFDQLTNPQYRLSNIAYTTGRGEGSAVGGYVITSDAGQSRGIIAFAFVVRGGRLLIDAIKVVPS